MAVSPINISRVTLGSNLTMDSLRANQREVFINQSRISSGRSFAVPSENPSAASQAFRFHNLLARQLQLTQNIQLGGSVLREADNAINELNALLIEAQTIASQNLSNLTTADERAAAAELVAAIRQQLITVGNRTFNGRYIFAGRQTQSAPFVDALGGVAYLGDTGRLDIRVSQGLLESINIPGNELFGALSSSVAGLVDLSPELTEDVRLEDLRGATGRGIRRGQLIFTEKDKGSFSADISGADTIGDVAALINAAAQQAGSTVTASLSSTGLDITPGSAALTVGDLAGGIVVADLGIKTSSPASSQITGVALAARLTRLTTVESMGQGLTDLSGGLLITNGDKQVAIDISDAQTVQDIINTINNAGVFIHARINDAGTAIDLFNQVSGTGLTITENGGTTAADLGLRTLASGTVVSRLNFGQGLGSVKGKDDLRIVGKDGETTVNVNLDGVSTIGDVIQAINEASTEAGASIKASLPPTGGILIEDSSGGGGSIRVSSLNLSTAADNLGLIVEPDATTGDLIGEEVGAVRANGILDVLIQLEKSLRGDDDQGITIAGERLSQVVEDVIRIHGVVGARSRGMEQQLDQMQEAAGTTGILLSQIEDLDFADAITKLQLSQTVLQASLLVTSQVQRLSLLDFIR